MAVSWREGMGDLVQERVAHLLLGVQQGQRARKRDPLLSVAA